MKSREQIIFDMCMTTDHSFGLVLDMPDCPGTLSSDERQAILRNMSQLYDHCIAPLVAEIKALQERIERSEARQIPAPK